MGGCDVAGVGWVQEPEADQRASQVQQTIQQVGATPVADLEPAAARQPGNVPFDLPATAAQALANSIESVVQIEDFIFENPAVYDTAASARW